MAASPQPTLSPAEFLAFDDASEFRSEYSDGHLVCMSGGTPNHSFLSHAIGREMAIALKGRGCNVSDSSLRLQVPGGTAYLYPDNMVICGGIQLAEGAKDTITNPTVIVEVLSNSTERWDRIGKFAKYRLIPTLKEYVLVAQDAMVIEWYSRRDQDEWLYHVASGPDGVLALESLEITVPLSVIYDNISLP